MPHLPTNHQHCRNNPARRCPPPTRNHGPYTRQQRRDSNSLEPYTLHAHLAKPAEPGPPRMAYLPKNDHSRLLVAVRQATQTSWKMDPATPCRLPTHLVTLCLRQPPIPPAYHYPRTLDTKHPHTHSTSVYELHHDQKAMYTTYTHQHRPRQTQPTQTRRYAIHP
jgi:hypothetical protein